jgi:nucleotide-binding universal stress UspA family protein
MKILVPTDFSETSFTAAQYAADLASTINATVHFVYVANTGAKQEELQKGHEDFSRLIHRLKTSKDQFDFTHDMIIVDGSVSKTIHDYAIKEKADLIVVGKSGAGLATKVFGSTTTKLLEISSVPLLIIPPEALFTPIKNILFATDLVLYRKQLPILSQYASSFSSTITMLHVSPDNISDGKQIEEAEELLRDKYSIQITLHVVEDDDVDEAITEYIKGHDVQLLALFPEESSFIETLTGKSVSHEMEQQTTVPLLALRMEDERERESVERMKKEEKTD